MEPDLDHTGMSRFFSAISRLLSFASDNYQRQCMRTYLDWCTFLGVQYGAKGCARAWRTANIDDVLDFINELKKRPGRKPQDARNTSNYAGGTIQLKVAILKSTYRKLLLRNQLRHNPFNDPTIPKISRSYNEKRVTPTVDFKLVRELLAAPADGTKRGLRDQAILCALFGGGLRRQECLNLKISDVRRTRAGTVYLYLAKTKSQESQEQPLPNWAVKKLFEYMAVRAEEGGKEDSPLFVAYRNRNGKGKKNVEIPGRTHLYPVSLYKRFKEWAKRVGLDEDVSPHSGRKTAINKLHAQGVDLRGLQQFARHKRMSTTEIYLRQQICIDDSPAKILRY